MHKNVVDIIVNIYRRLQSGEILKEIKAEDFDSYKKSEFLAAYSYVLENHSQKNIENTLQFPRILHLAERIIIDPQAYGYLLELNKLGLLKFDDTEHIIEQTMTNTSSRITLEQMKTIVAWYFSKKNTPQGEQRNFTGNETIN